MHTAEGFPEGHLHAAVAFDHAVNYTLPVFRTPTWTDRENARSSTCAAMRRPRESRDVVGGRGGGVGGGSLITRVVVVYMGTPHSYNAVTEHDGVSPVRLADLEEGGGLLFRFPVEPLSGVPRRRRASRGCVFRYPAGRR